VKTVREYDKFIKDLIRRFRTSGEFWSSEIRIPSERRSAWVCMRNNPSHFTQSMFIGRWSVPDKYPGEELIRLVRLMETADGSMRVIGRQGKDLFVLTV